MTKQNSKEKTAIVIIHEIYGINNHILDMRKKFEDSGYDVYCIDLLDGRTFHYDESEEAYSYFVNDVGFEKAKLQVIDYISNIPNCYEKIFLLGYSIGATIAWVCSEKSSLFNGIIGYYGSRIRDYVSIEPQVETLLFFPSEEKSFNVNVLINTLKGKEKVRTYQFNGLHGFADLYSKHVNSEEKELSEKILEEFIIDMCKK